MKFDKVSEVMFNGKSYLIGQVGQFRNKDKFGGWKEYYLFDNKKIYGEMHINLSSYPSNFRQIYQGYGIEELPSTCFCLEKIQILKKFQGKGLGSVLLNFALEEIEDFNNKNSCNLKLILERENSEQTLPFYKKFDARVNDNSPSDKIGDYCYMIIDYPRHVEKYESTKLLDGGLNKE